MKFSKLYSLLLVFITSLLSCNNATKKEEVKQETKTVENMSNLQEATFGGGCFWCIEGVFSIMDGVVKAESGYEGGDTKNPTYKEICTGLTNHAEVVKVTYDSTKVSYKELLEVFFTVHDPTTLNRQGNDVGTQYPSVIFYHNEYQKKEAEEIITKLTEAKVYDSKIVTQVQPTSTFYKAEDYHQLYFQNNGNEPYCRFVVKPKVDKFKKVFADKVKK